MSTKDAGRSNVHTRRNLAEFTGTDPYAPKVDPGNVLLCTQCQAIYQRRHWFFDAEAYFHFDMQPDTIKGLCPACQKIRDRYADGQVVLHASPFLTAHKDEILRLIHNEETRAKGLNPLERLIEVSESDAGITVTTTTEKLAQRIGRAVKSAYQGETTYRWSDPKYLSVEWQRAE
ncbi:MAG: BCAM0308 family protein [Candidatus Binatia bacterium]